MYFSDEITLIAVRYDRDAGGNMIGQEEPERVIYGDLKSVTQNEFFAGAREGMKNQIRVDVRKMDYQGERKAEISGKRYEIYRTYHQRPDTIELYMREARDGNKDIR